MFETFGFETLSAPQAAIYFGLVLGLAFGALAEVTRFCFRRGLVGPAAERRPALAVWLTALAVAILGTQGAVAAGWISFAEHRFLSPDLPWAAIALGGLLFGAGMVLTRGCASRLTVLAGSGNLRAALVLVVFALTAHATLKGVLAPLRQQLGTLTLPLGEAAALSTPWAVALAFALLGWAVTSGARRGHLAGAAALGLLVPLGWVGTGFVLYDDFDPIALESLSFTAPAADSLFWTVAASAVPARFGVGLVGGVLIGAAVLALISGRFRWQSFESPAQTGRYLSGAALMGFGGVLAGGCTVGAGLSGVPTLGLSALLALGAIAAGGIATNRALARFSESSSGSAAPSATPPAPQRA
ncbi:MAG: YeeE/YedE family protein [Paracoccaceae bacterium]